jgi:DNA-binding transcriptional LysR family regulator
MNWGAFDLNLLVVFDAVMQERSVTRAGERVRLSQPAVSHALNRLRYLLKDDLFVRTPQGMVPTPRAEQLAVPIRQALSDMQLALEPDSFVPGTAKRQFHIAVNNYAAVVLAPPIIAAVCAAAPFVQLDVQPSGTLNVPYLLDRGELDLALGRFEYPGERFAIEPFEGDRFVAVMRRDHPAGACGKRLSAEVFAALPHLEISSSGDDISFIDRWLAERGLAREVAHRAPYLAAAALLARSDMVATLRERIAREFVRHSPLEIREPPYDSPVIRDVMLWHRRLDKQPAHRWLRQTISSVSRTPD